MTPAEADRRIILSRQTISTYLDMLDAGIRPSEGTMILLHEEIAMLEGIAEAHPGKVEKIESIIRKYRSLIRIMKNQLH